MVAGVERAGSAAAVARDPGIAASLPLLEPLLVAPDEGLFLFSPTFTCLYVNAAGAAMRGVPADELVGDSFIEWPPAPSDAGIAASMRRAIGTGEVQHFGPIHHDDGRVVGDFAHVHVPVPDGVLALVKRLGGGPGPGAPITSARAAELSAREAELSTILDVLPVGVTVMDAHGADIRHNPAARRALHFTDENVAAGRYRERRFVRPDGAPMPPEAFASARAIAEAHPVSDVEMGVVLEDGETIWVSVSAAPVTAGGVSAVVVTQDITERRAAEDALRQRDTELREAQRIAGIGSATWDAATDAMAWSPEMYGLFGMNPDGPAPTFAEAARAFRPDSLARMQAAVARAVSSREPFEGEFEIVLPDGTGRTLVFRGEARLDASGSLVGSRLIAYDVTNRHEVRLLREAEKELAEAQRLAHIGSWTWSPAGDLVAWSGEMFRLVGLEPGGPAPTFAEQARFFGADVGARMGELVERAMATGESWQLDYASVRVDGSERHLHNEGEVVRDASGAIVGVRGTVADVTEARDAERALRATAARDALLVDENTEGIIRVALPRGRFLDVNPAACAIFGHPRAELLAMDLIDLTESDPQRACLDLPSEVLAGGTATLDRSIVRGDGSRAIVSARLRQLPDDSILVTVSDMTRRRSLEAQVQQAARMEAVGRLAGGIAHDFNNLLMAINGYAGLVADVLPPGDPLRPDIEAIREAGERGAVLTRQLLAFGRRQVLQPTAVDVGAIVAGLRAILSRLLGEDVALYIRSDPGIGPVWADPAQLEQIVVNLVTNARDAMPDGGAVAIETAEIEIGAEDPRLRARAAPGRYVRLAVTDTGTGMDAATLSHVLEPFFTTKAAGRGTGLGLSTVEGIVAQSGGFVAIESEVGRGTTFDVFLPRTDAAPQGRPATSARVTVAMPRGTETVLVVEDEPAVRAVTGRMLRGLGYEVLEATGPTQALAISGSHESPIDLLITDVVMPEMNGRALAERLQGQRPALAVLFMSGYSPDSVFRDGYLSEGAAYLRKPFTRDAFAASVRSVLDARGHAETGAGATRTEAR